MKPRIFLSHSKMDREFIERIASDLRRARIDVWYDDWEIPPGASLRAKVFEDGIPGCDLFFVYLTPESIDSTWVRRELDAAFVVEVQRSGSFTMALFVDSVEIRERLSPDLQSLRISIINGEDYSQAFSELVASSWEALLKRKMTEAKESLRSAKLELEKKVVEQELEITNLRARGIVDRSAILRELDQTRITVGDKTATLGELFQGLGNSIASGATLTSIPHSVCRYLGVESKLLRDASDVVGPLVILGLVQIIPPQGEWYELVYLTELGADLLRELRVRSARAPAP